jgi:hypothetical protein
VAQVLSGFRTPLWGSWHAVQVAWPGGAVVACGRWQSAQARGGAAGAWGPPRWQPAHAAWPGLVAARPASAVWQVAQAGRGAVGWWPAPTWHPVQAVWAPAADVDRTWGAWQRLHEVSPAGRNGVAPCGGWQVSHEVLPAWWAVGDGCWWQAAQVAAAIARTGPARCGGWHEVHDGPPGPTGWCESVVAWQLAQRAVALPTSWLSWQLAHARWAGERSAPITTLAGWQVAQSAAVSAVKVWPWWQVAHAVWPRSIARGVIAGDRRRWHDRQRSDDGAPSSWAPWQSVQPPTSAP